MRFTRTPSIAMVIPFLAVVTVLAGPIEAELSARWQPMNQPVEAFRIIGNVYYVGASSVTSFLITTPDGHILVDGGFEETVPLIRTGIESLGFRIEDVGLLVNSHAHFDHAGGLAALQRLSGARFVASARETPALERGGRDDDLLGNDGTFPAIEVDQQVADGESVSFGGTTLTARVTAGHTRGCTSWDFETREGARTYRVVSICSLSVLPGMVFEETPTYPSIADDFRASFAALEAIPADVFLASHAGFFGLKGKRARQQAEPDAPNPFIDPEGYGAYIAEARSRFDKALAEERAARILVAAPPPPGR